MECFLNFYKCIIYVLVVTNAKGHGKVVHFLDPGASKDIQNEEY